MPPATQFADPDRFDMSRVKKGDRAAIFYPSANRDEMRTPNPHTAFGGGGTHFCRSEPAMVEVTTLVSEVCCRG